MLADQGHADLAHANEGPQVTEPVWPRIQHRLDTLEIDRLVADYQAGRSLADLASEFDIHRRTVAMHLERRGVARRATLRKMSHTDIEEAARRYRAGDSLATVGSALHVDAATVRRELQRAGVTIRQRRGW